jgi:hypothetical protein
MDQASLTLGVSIVKQGVEKDIADDDTLDEKVIKVFKATFDESYTWFVTTDNDRFIIGNAVLMLISDEETKCRIEQEVKFLRGLNAASSGIPVDFGPLMDGWEPVGLQRLFEEAKGAPIQR